MAKPLTEFLNVDLDLKSQASLDRFASVMGRAAITLHVGRIGRKHHARFELSREPKDPADAVRQFVKLIDGLPTSLRRVWSRSTRELDIGIQSGFGEASQEWLVGGELIRQAARLGVGIRITVYPIRTARCGKKPGTRRAG